MAARKQLAQLEAAQAIHRRATELLDDVVAHKEFEAIAVIAEDGASPPMYVGLDGGL